MQVAPMNERRAFLAVQLLPNNIVSGNTGLVYGKFGSAPIASLTSNSWDFVLNAGAEDGTNLYEARDEALVTQELWLIADTAGQEVNVVERTKFPAPVKPESGAAGS